MIQPGDLVTFADGYHFYITVHGPLVTGTCADCGTPVAVVGYTDRVNQWGLKEDTGGGVVPRCSGCARRFHGLDEA